MTSGPTGTSPPAGCWRPAPDSGHTLSNDRLRGIIDSLRGPVQFTHDALGNLAAATHADGRVEWRLPDAVGNLFQTRDRSDRKYGPAGQLLQASDARGTTRYAYDPEGNLIEKLEPDGKRWTYRWNLSGMLVEVERPDGDVVAFAYDPLGRRIGKTFRGKTSHWIWDGNVPLHEWVTLSDEALARDGVPLRSSAEREIALGKRRALLAQRSAQGPPPGQADARLPEVPPLEGTPESPITWLFEPESFAPLAKLVSDERYSIVTDHLGTPRAMYDERGSESWAAEIDTYGALRELRGQRRACPFRFPGQYEDEETGLYYNRFRYYDPGTGGYVSRDPIGLAGGRALHGYVSDPLCRLDPLGLTECDRPTKKRAFWSGGTVVREAAEDWAQKHGYTTLEQTVTGKRLSRATQGMAWLTQARPRWARASERYARGAAGEVHVFQRESGVRIATPSEPGTIWQEREYPALMQNPKITSLVYHLVRDDGTSYLAS
jgi:RHS repeat-associated protein